MFHKHNLLTVSVILANLKKEIKKLVCLHFEKNTDFFSLHFISLTFLEICSIFRIKNL